MSTINTHAETLLASYICNTTNIILDDEESNGWERQVQNLNFITNLCKAVVFTEEIEQFLSTGVLPLLLDTIELQGAEALTITTRSNVQYFVKIQPQWL